MLNLLLNLPFFSSLSFILGSWTSPDVMDVPACTKPSVRREWRKLSLDERADWISAFNCLGNLPHDDALSPIVDPAVSHIPPVNTSGSYWDDIVYIHMDVNTRIHGTGLFLPWHRFYVHAVESAMKDRCGYTGAFPYWDWTIDAHDIPNSPLFLDASPHHGLGGWGDPTDDYQIHTGAFRSRLPSYPVPHRLRRNFTLQPFEALARVVPIFPNASQWANESFTRGEVEKSVGWGASAGGGDFVGFQKFLEAPQGPHASLHFIVGGDMSGFCPSNAPAPCYPQATFSANEPLFFLHHAMVDKIWYTWQQSHPANFWAYKGGSVQNLTSLQALEDWPNGMAPELHLDSRIPASGMFPELTIGEVMNTTGGHLCYIYE